MDYRIWAVTGIALIIVELVTPSFFLVFLGVGAIVTAITALAGVTAGLSSQLVVFCVSSVVLTAFFRQKVKRRFGRETLPPDYMSQRVKVSRTIPRGEEGKVFYRGAEWIAFSETAHEEIPEGSLVEVVGSEGLRLKVRKM